MFVYVYSVYVHSVSLKCAIEGRGKFSINNQKSLSLGSTTNSKECSQFYSEYFGTLLSVLLYYYPAFIHSCVTRAITYSNQFKESLSNPLIKRQDTELRMVKIQYNSFIIVTVLRAGLPRNFISIYGMAGDVSHL
jgi:hypothetical protein